MVKDGYIEFTANSFSVYAIVDTSAKAERAKGDVDGDGEISSGDARLALRASVKLEDYAPDSAEFMAADVDGSGEVESSDARTILRVSVKLESFA